MNKQGKIIFSLLSYVNYATELEVNNVMDFMEKYEDIYIGYDMESGKMNLDIAILEAVKDIIMKRDPDKHICGIMFILRGGNELSLSDVTHTFEIIDKVLNLNDSVTKTFGIKIDEKLNNKAEITLLVGVD